ncbi:hypothetical protein ACFQX6_36895 [Streptosporangium lutulentum]
MGIAVLLALALADVGGIRRGAVVAVAVALLGMALGRLTAHLVERPSAFYPSWLYFWVEAAERWSSPRHRLVSAQAAHGVSSAPGRVPSADRLDVTANPRLVIEVAESPVQRLR